MTQPQPRPRVALLPLYLELYDRAIPHLLGKQQPFLDRVAALLGSQGIEVTVLPVSRTEPQVAAALSEAENEGVDGLITLHLAYSPSLEAGPALARSSLPLLLLDTTPAASFGHGATTDDLLQNHGIHGVQDLASVLRREGWPYSVVAGAVEDPRLLAKLCDWARAAQGRGLLRRLRVAQIGDSFAGMGDFSVTAEFLKDVLGPEVVRVEVARVGELCVEVGADELAAEREADLGAFDCRGCHEACWDRSNRAGLGLRRALAEVDADAFSMNFASFDRGLGTPTVPFLEASKAMARGLGYAGEGDVLTASLVAVLNRSYGPTTFTEMFCPDWAGGRVLMSHMGECNPALAKRRPRLVEKDYAFGPAGNPAVLIFPLRPGPAALVNLAPNEEGSLTLISSDVVVEGMEVAPGLAQAPHFWIRPPGNDVAGFLERYSEAGGTHHLALTPSLGAGDLRPLAELLGLRFVLLG